MKPKRTYRFIVRLDSGDIFHRDVQGESMAAELEGLEQHFIQARKSGENVFFTKMRQEDSEYIGALSLSPPKITYCYIVDFEEMMGITKSIDQDEPDA